jgi:hypothetical protein
MRPHPTTTTADNRTIKIHKKWNAPSQEEEKIIALEARITLQAANESTRGWSDPEALRVRVGYKAVEMGVVLRFNSTPQPQTTSWNKRTMKAHNKWNAPSQKKERILALEARVEQLTNPQEAGPTPKHTVRSSKRVQETQKQAL